MFFRRFPLLLALLLLALPTAFASEADPTVVRVNEISYPLSLVRFSLDPYLSLADVTGEEIPDDTYAALVEETVNHFISLGVIENKLMETGHHDFTEDEMDILRAEASAQFEQTWQQIRQDMLSYDESVTEEQITSWMISRGYTKDAFVRELVVQERESRIIDLYCGDVDVTEEEVQDYYRKSFLEPAREKYEHNIPLYEKEILLPKLESFYTPEGYRYLKNILMAYPEEIQEQLDAMKPEGARRVTAVQNAYDRLAEAAAAGEDIAAPKEAYDKKLAELRAYEAEYREKEREAIPLLQSKIDLIRSQLASGVSIDSLLLEYSLDQAQTGSDKPGMLYHTDSEYWTEDMKAAVDAMKQIGELSAPFADEKGVHLMYYAGDVPSGERQLNDGEQAQLRASALYAAQVEKLSGLIEEWKKTCDIETNPSLLAR